MSMINFILSSLVSCFSSGMLIMGTSGFHHSPKKCRLLFSLLSVTFLGHTTEVTTKLRGPEMGSSSTWGSDSFDIAQRAVHPEVSSTLGSYAVLFPWTLPLPSSVIPFLDSFRHWLTYICPIKCSQPALRPILGDLFEFQTKVPNNHSFVT